MVAIDLSDFESFWAEMIHHGLDGSAMMDTSNDGLSVLPQIKEDRWMIGNH